MRKPKILGDVEGFASIKLVQGVEIQTKRQNNWILVMYP